MSNDTEKQATFWEHLDELRMVILKIGMAVLLVSVVAFCMKDSLFRFILAPCHSDFFLYRLMDASDFSIQLMNTKLTEQFMVHMRVAIYVGVMVVAPYILYMLFQFVSPGLYQNEKRYARGVLVSAYFMFFIGAAINYILIFPLTVRFLGNYQVAESVANMLTISNYIDTLMSMNLLIGSVFELPVVCWLAGKLGLIKRQSMQKYRRHAIVAILIVAAIITPTTDMLTLIIVSLPIWMLYEASIFLVKN